MIYDINFWQEPDWQRESSINPTVVLSTLGLILAMVVISLYGTALAKNSALQGRRSQLMQSIDNNREDVQDILREQEVTNFWISAIKELEARSQKRLLTSRQLEALAMIVPPSMLFSRLEYNEEPISITVPVAAGQRAQPQRPGWRYVMTIRGSVISEGADNIISEFSNELLRNPRLAGLMASAGVSRSSPRSQTNDKMGKDFEIRCTYIDIDLEAPNAR